MDLNTFFQEHPRAAIAFSGGADSAFLLWSARQAGCDVTALYAKTQFQPAFELEDARRFCKAYSILLQVIEYDVLAVPSVSENGPRRCYYCKKALFSKLWEYAQEHSCPELWDGTNASDDTQDRPGVQALQELGVLSPLRLCGVTKSRLRMLSMEAGLFTHSKPAYACLATRIPVNTPLTGALLSRVEKAEAAVARLGFSGFRVRVLQDYAKLQVLEDQLPFALSIREHLVKSLLPFFPAGVLLDLQPRTEEKLIL